MVDLWGPGAFGAADSAAIEPTFNPGDGPGDPDSFFADCSSPIADDGTEWRAALINMLVKQLRGIVRHSSVAESNLNPLLLAQAIASGHANWALATGTANAWVVTPALEVPAYAAGRVLNIIAPATNTSTTVNANVSTRGDRRIKKADGTDPAIGDLIAGRAYTVFDYGGALRVLGQLPSDLGAALTAEGGRILNYRVYTTTARSVLTGALNPGIVLWSQTFPKLKDNTRLVFEASPSLRLNSNASTTYARARLNSDSGTDRLQNHYLFANNDPDNYQPVQFNKFSWTGISKGDVLVEFRVGQQQTNSGTIVVNPSTTDGTGWVNGYSSIFTIYEVEN